jgi:hypothetical protein
MSDVVVTKWCSGHRSEHPSTEFGRDKHEPDGLNRRCKAYVRSLPIDRAAARQRFKKYNATAKARDRHARFKERHPTADQEKQRRYRQKNTVAALERDRRERVVHRDRYLARKSLDTAVRRGKVVRPAHCSLCGIACKPHGHHDDYTKRLDVRWLCARCHKNVHPGGERAWTA